MTNLDLQTRNSSSKHQGKFINKQMLSLPWLPKTDSVNPQWTYSFSENIEYTGEPTASCLAVCLQPGPAIILNECKKNKWTAKLLGPMQLCRLRFRTSVLDRKACGPLEGRVPTSHVTSIFPTAYLRHFSGRTAVGFTSGPSLCQQKGGGG